MFRFCVKNTIRPSVHMSIICFVSYTSIIKTWEKNDKNGEQIRNLTYTRENKDNIIHM